jgi:hypothetical protein
LLFNSKPWKSPGFAPTVKTHNKTRHLIRRPHTVSEIHIPDQNWYV